MQEPCRSRLAGDGDLAGLIAGELATGCLLESQAKKNPPKRVFSKTIGDSLSVPPCRWSIVPDPAALPVLQLME
jgi:hypothetical protein